MTKPRGSNRVNEGIQATNVHADVLAVGRHARAEQHLSSPTDAAALTAAIGELLRGVDALNLQPAARRLIAEELTQLEQTRESDKVADTVAGLVGKLNSAGVVIGGVASVMEPLRKIAGLLNLGLPIL